MQEWDWITVVLIGIVAFGVLGSLALIRSRRRRRLQERFGPEYHHAVSTSGRREAERRLDEVEKKHDELAIRPLPAVARERYLEEWRQAETRFVSDPRDAARAAERILVRVLDDRGYPVDVDTEDQAAHFAADHPDVVERYRHGHAMLDAVDGPESTETLRKAMIDFRAVLEALLEDERRVVAA